MLTQADLPDDMDALRALVLEQSRLLVEERAASEARLTELGVAKGEADARSSVFSRSSMPSCGTVSAAGPSGHVTVLCLSLISLCHLGFEGERANAAQI